MENAYYSGISPEGCAAILWKDRSAAPAAAAALKMVASDLLALGLVDEVIPEPLGGAHNDPAAAAAALKQSVLKHLAELQKLSGEERRRQRYAKFRAYGRFTQQPSRLTAPVETAPAVGAAETQVAGSGAPAS